MLIVIDGVGIKRGGGVSILLELTRALASARAHWRFHLLLLSPGYREFGDPSVPANVTVEHVPLVNSGLSRICWINRFLPQKLRTLRADAVFCLANIGCARPPVPQVVYLHQMKAILPTLPAGIAWHRRARLRLMRYLILRGATASDAIVVQTQVMKDLLQRLAPHLEQKVHVIPAGLRTDRSARALSDELAVKLEACGRPWLVFPAHHGEHKNHELLLRALPSVRENFPSATLLLTFLYNPSETSRELPGAPMAVAQRIAPLLVDLSKQGAVKCLGELRSEELAHVLERSDVMVFPSLAESFGLPLVEAMSARCPVVAADLPYAHEVAGPAAIYFDATDPSDCSASVSAILRDSHSADRLRHEGLARLERYAYPRIAEQVAELLGSVIANARTGAAPRR